MALVSAGDLIAYAFRISGIYAAGQSASAADSADALITLGAMIAQWQRRRWLVWDLVETVLTATGAASYLVGPTGDFAIARPDHITAAFARFLPETGGQTIDYPLAIIDAREDYNRIVVKTESSVPAGVFYDAAWPTGTLYVWPVPAAGAYEIHIFTPAVLPPLANLTDALNVPPEYIEALKYGLAVRLTMDWGLEPKPVHIQAMHSALQIIRVANLGIPELNMAGVPGRRRNIGSNYAAFQTGWML